MYRKRKFALTAITLVSCLSFAQPTLAKPKPNVDVIVIDLTQLPQFVPPLAKGWIRVPFQHVGRGQGATQAAAIRAAQIAAATKMVNGGKTLGACAGSQRVIASVTGSRDAGAWNAGYGRFGRTWVISGFYDTAPTKVCPALVVQPVVPR